VNREIEIGIRMTVEAGVNFFGMEELRELIDQGAKILNIKEGGALMQKAGENEDIVSMYFSGGSFKVSLAVPER